MDLPDKPLQQFTRLLRQNEAITPSRATRITAYYCKILPSALLRPIERKMIEKSELIQPDKPPVFVLGHWRSGTTFLQFLLSQDPKFIYHSKFQTFFPGIYKLTEPVFKKGADYFLQLFDGVKAWRKNISVTMDLDSPSETEAAAINLISPTTYHWGHIYPQSWRWYFDKFLFMENLSEKEWQLWKQTMQYIISKRLRRAPDKQLLIKNPGDTGRIEHLLKLYPNAKFVFIHRNPYEVFYSNRKLWNNVLQTVSLQKISAQKLDTIILELYEKLHRRYFEQKQLLYDNQIAEVRYEDLKHHPIRELSEVYDKLELPDFRQARPHFSAFMAKNQRESAVRQYEYQPADLAKVNAHWDFAFQKWGYAMHESAGSTVKPVQ